MSKLQDDIRSLLDLSVPAPGVDTPAKPVTRPVYHCDECSCESCSSIRDSIERYQEARRLFNINNWWNS